MTNYSAEKVRSAVDRMTTQIDFPFDERIVDELKNLLDQTPPEQQDEEVEQYLFRYYFGNPGNTNVRLRFIPHRMVWQLYDYSIITQGMLISYFDCNNIPKGSLPLAGSVVTRWMAMVNFMINKWEAVKPPHWQIRFRELCNVRARFVAFARDFDGEHIPSKMLRGFKRISKIFIHCKALRDYIKQNEENDVPVQDPVQPINFFVDYFKDHNETKKQ